MSGTRVADVLAAVGERFPWDWAEPWDRVGLLVGDREGAVARVLVALDPTREAVAEAARLGAEVLLTHHPVFLDAPGRWLADDPASGVAFAAASAGVALIAAHTNLDRAPEGAGALAAALGLAEGEPLESGSAAVETLVTYVPRDALDAVLDALASAGAGRIGRYDGCSYASDGTGRFRPLEGATPSTGAVGERVAADEVRIESQCAPGTGDAAAAAVRAVHPYEEPVFTVTPGSLSLGVARAGRVSALDTPSTLEALARQAGERLGVTPRAYGGPDTAVRVVATMGGSGRSVVDAALRAGADVLVTGELRYHDALAAVSRGLAVVECGHDATELPLLAPLADAARDVPGLGREDVMLHSPRLAWWTPKER